MGTVLYECRWVLDIHGWIPLFLLIVGLILLVQNWSIKSARIFFLFFVFFSAAVSLISVAEQVDQYNQIVAAY